MYIILSKSIHIGIDFNIFITNPLKIDLFLQVYNETEEYNNHEHIF